MKLGIIGDDFTGSSDIANNLKKSGMQVSMYAGVPTILAEKTKKQLTDAAVIALKTRTIPIRDAIKESLEALSWLRDCGCEQFIFKYCSTFDSTKEGNIGPITDAIMEALNTDFTIACPSFPDAGRTVYFGHMFVNGKPLNESGMENHPLTPMTDHNLVRWLDHQTKNNVGLIDFQTISKGANSVKERVESLKTNGYKYAIVDTIKNDDFDIICNGVKDLPFLTGGSGIALGLPKIYKDRGLLSVSNFQIPENNSNAVILSGSCSVTTINQIVMSDISSRVTAIIVDKLGVDENEVVATASFTNDLGADSLDTVELIMEFEREFDIQIPDDQAEKIETVGQAIKYIESTK